MHKLSSRALVGMATIAILVAACGGGGATQAPSAEAPSAEAPSAAASEPASAAPVEPKLAVTAAEAGGVDAICEAAKVEGQVNVIALPPDWANYGQMISDFEAKYGIKVNSDQPDANSQQEIDAAKQLAGTGRQPDTFDLGANVALANLDLFQPYKIAAWDQIPADLKDPDGKWTANYAGYMSIGYDGSLGEIKTVADLLKPEFKGKVALNGDPTKASAGYHGVVMAALANGGSADDISAGVEFFKKLNDAGNLLPVDPTPATIASGQTPIVIDWEYNNAAQTAALQPKGIEWKVVVPSDAPPVAAYYRHAINADTANPAAARCWAEYLYSPAGHNTWLKGFARPVLMDQMITDGTVDQAALGALAAVTESAVSLSQDQLAAGQEYLTANWNITIQ